jgi:hypothetical protein
VPVYSGIRNITVSTHGSNLTYQSFDLDGDGVNDFELFLNRSTSLTLGASGSGLGTAGSAYLHIHTGGGYNAILATSGSIEARRLALGAPISAGVGNFVTSYVYPLLRYATTGGYPASGQWNPSDLNAFAGVRFRIGTADHFAWIRLHVGDRDGVPFSLTAVDWAYEDVPGQRIEAGAGLPAAIPEPSPLALLAVGAVGLLAWRRRRAQQASSQQSS